jgi:hypothetical protein
VDTAATGEARADARKLLNFHSFCQIELLRTCGAARYNLCGEKSKAVSGHNLGSKRPAPGKAPAVCIF